MACARRRVGHRIVSPLEGRSEMRGLNLSPRVLAGIAAPMVLAVSGLAVAKPGGALKERSSSFTVQGFGEGTAKCKRGQQAVGGGFYVERGEDDGAGSLASERQGKRGWRFRLWANENPNDAGLDASAYVYCAKKRKLVTRSTTRVIDGFEPETVSAECPGSKDAVAGGFAAPDSFNIVVAMSRLADEDEWEVRFVRADGASVTVYVLCQKLRRGLRTETDTITVNSSVFDSPVSASCRGKRRVRTGGFDAEFDLTDLGSPQATVDGSRRAGKRTWEATVNGIQGVADVTVYAYCERKPKKKR
jgi:hypothetical protein